MIDTPRFLLREIDPAVDAAGIHEMNLDPEVLRWVHDEPFASVEATRVFYERYVREVYPSGFGRLSVIDKTSGAFVGWCGLKLVEGEIDLGYRFLRKHWGKGVATETARACVEWGFRERDVERIVAWVHPRNIASARVLAKLAFARAGEKKIGDLLVGCWELNAPAGAR